MIERPDGFDDERARLQQFGVCGIVATGIAAGVRYDVAKAALKRAMHKLYPSRQRMRGSTTYAQRNEALKSLAVKFKEWPELVGTSIADFAAIYADLGTTYMVCYPRHVFTIRNGWVCDQSYNGPVGGWKHRNKKINRPVIEILGKGW